MRQSFQQSSPLGEPKSFGSCRNFVGISLYDFDVIETTCTFSSCALFCREHNYCKMRAYLGVITILSLLFVAFSDESPGPIVKARLEVGGQQRWSFCYSLLFKFCFGSNWFLF